MDFQYKNIQEYKLAFNVLKKWTFFSLHFLNYKRFIDFALFVALTLNRVLHGGQAIPEIDGTRRDLTD